MSLSITKMSALSATISHELCYVCERPTGEIKGTFILVAGSKKASVEEGEEEKERKRGRVDKVKYPAKIRPPLRKRRESEQGS